MILKYLKLHFFFFFEDNIYSFEVRLFEVILMQALSGDFLHACDKMHA